MSTLRVVIVGSEGLDRVKSIFVGLDAQSPNKPAASPPYSSRRPQAQDTAIIHEDDASGDDEASSFLSADRGPKVAPKSPMISDAASRNRPQPRGVAYAPFASPNTADPRARERDLPVSAGADRTAAQKEQPPPVAPRRVGRGSGSAQALKEAVPSGAARVSKNNADPRARERGSVQGDNVNAPSEEQPPPVAPRRRGRGSDSARGASQKPRPYGPFAEENNANSQEYQQPSPVEPQPAPYVPYSSQSKDSEGYDPRARVRSIPYSAQLSQRDRASSPYSKSNSSRRARSPVAQRGRYSAPAYGGRDSRRRARSPKSRPDNGTGAPQALSPKGRPDNGTPQALSPRRRPDINTPPAVAAPRSRGSSNAEASPLPVTPPVAPPRPAGLGLGNGATPAPASQRNSLQSKFGFNRSTPASRGNNLVAVLPTSFKGPEKFRPLKSPLAGQSQKGRQQVNGPRQDVSLQSSSQPAQNENFSEAGSRPQSAAPEVQPRQKQSNSIRSFGARSRQRVRPQQRGAQRSQQNAYSRGAQPNVERPQENGSPRGAQPNIERPQEDSYSRSAQPNYQRPQSAAYSRGSRSSNDRQSAAAAPQQRFDRPPASNRVGASDEGPSLLVPDRDATIAPAAAAARSNRVAAANRAAAAAAANVAIPKYRKAPYASRKLGHGALANSQVGASSAIGVDPYAPKATPASVNKALRSVGIF